jgi:hypothetical protein
VTPSASSAGSWSAQDLAEIKRHAARHLCAVDGMLARLICLRRRGCEYPDVAREMDDIGCQLELARRAYEAMMAALS